MLALVLAGPACETSRIVKPSAAIAIAVDPNPVVIQVACLQSQPPPEFCLASLDATITISETGGVGGRLEAIDLVVRNTSTGATETEVTLGPDWVRAQAGTDRIEAFGRLAFRPVVSGYRVRNGMVQSLAFVIGVRFVDDNGNVVEQTVQVGGA